MKRGELAGAIAAATEGEDVVVVTSLGSTSRAWRSVGARNPTFYGSDPMGLAASTALGLAIARLPNRVLFLAGDGDLMMSATALFAIAGATDVALGIVVFANDRYETGGGQPLAGNARTDLAALAAAAGLRAVIGPHDSIADLLAALFAEPGVALAVVEVEPEASPYGGPGTVSGAEDRQRFRDELADHDARREVRT